MIDADTIDAHIELLRRNALASMTEDFRRPIIRVLYELEREARKHIIADDYWGQW